MAFGAAWLSARAAGGRVLLRIEDVDRERARAEVEAAIREDLAWLGLDWDAETPPQRDRDYGPALARVSAALGAYRCACRRAPQPYPGTCRDAGHAEGAIRVRLPPGPVAFVDRRLGPQRVDPGAVFGDPILRRRDGRTTYPLAVVADDLADGVTEVVRGADLLAYTAVQLHLWAALGASPPSWLHAPVLLGPDGRKLSKSDGATGIAELRAAGRTPRDVWRALLPALGLEAEHVHDAVDAFRPDLGPAGPLPVSALGVGASPAGGGGRGAAGAGSG